jgi:hypothetical protein
MLWKVGAEVRIAEVAEYELVAPEFKNVVLMLASLELAQL